MNIYKEHYDEVRSFEGDMGVQMDAFDAAHGLPYDALALCADRRAGAAERGGQAAVGAVKTRKTA